MSSYPDEPPQAYHANGSAPGYENEKGFSQEKRASIIEPHPEYDVIERSGGNQLHRDLKSRHMQMIAIGKMLLTSLA